MKTRLMILVILVLSITALPLTARPGNDPNAAVRYLNAIGTLPVIPDVVIAKLEKAETLEQYKALDADTRAALGDNKLKTTMRLLKQGAACKECNFTPDDTYSVDDAVPPYRRIRQLARLARVCAFDREVAGDLDESFAVLTATFMLGQHVEDHGLLISTMIGVAVRKIAAQALIEFRQRHPEPTWRDQTLTFFKRIPRPSANLLASLRYEREGLEKILGAAKKNPEIFRDLAIEIPGLESGSGSGSGSASGSQVTDSGAKTKACHANQRVLMGALEMLAMDYNMPLPATITADLPKALTDLRYMKSWPVCPAGGHYRLNLDDKGNPEVACSGHGTPDAPSAAAAKSQEDKLERSVKYLTELSKTPEYDRLVGECGKLYDELLTIDPMAADYEKRSTAFQKKLEATTNIFAASVIPNFKKAGEVATSLEKKIDELLK